MGSSPIVSTILTRGFAFKTRTGSSEIARLGNIWGTSRCVRDGPDGSSKGLRGPGEAAQSGGQGVVAFGGGPGGRRPGQLGEVGAAQQVAIRRGEEKVLGEAPTRRARWARTSAWT